MIAQRTPFLKTDCWSCLPSSEASTPQACVPITIRHCSAQQCTLASLPLHGPPVHAAHLLLTLIPYAGGQLAAWLRVRYPDVVAGAISSSPTLLGAPGLGLVSQPVPLSNMQDGSMHSRVLLQWPASPFQTL